MDDDDTLLEDLRRRIAASPFHAGFGISVEHAAAGDVRLGWEARADHRNLQGLVHGGILATLVDIAMGLAIRTVVGALSSESSLRIDFVDELSRRGRR